jgi:uncharacterized membrane protein YcfT
MDAVRGTAILLLLIWHASAVPELYGREMPEVIRTVNAFFTPFRMPTLMLLSGVLLSKSLRKPLPTYFSGKFSMILWPYVIWVIIAKLTFLEVVGLPWWHWRAWYATSYLWFLFFIGVYYLAAPLLSWLPRWVPVAIAATAGLLLPAGTTEQHMAYFAVFFFTGDWLAQHPKLLEKATTARFAVWLIPVVLATGVASSLWTEAMHYTVWSAPLSVAGMLLLAAGFSRLTAAGRGAPALQSLGRSSLIYYVSHFPLMAVLCMIVPESVPPLVLAILNLALALVAGWALASLKERAPVKWLFSAPRPLVRGVEAALARALPRPFRTNGVRGGDAGDPRPHR